MQHVMDRIERAQLRRKLVVLNWFMLGVLLGAVVVRIFG